MSKVVFKKSDAEELNSLLENEQKSLDDALFQLRTSELKNHCVIKTHRKNIARIKTEAKAKGVSLNG